MKLKDLAQLVKQKRGNMGVRAAAREINISPTTLTKIEHGHVPDMKTLNKVCKWIGEEPEQFSEMGGLQIAFKQKAAVPKEVAKSLAVLIQRVGEEFSNKIKVEGH